MQNKSCKEVHGLYSSSTGVSCYNMTIGTQENTPCLYQSCGEWKGREIMQVNKNCFTCDVSQLERNAANTSIDISCLRYVFFKQVPGISHDFGHK